MPSTNMQLSHFILTASKFKFLFWVLLIMLIHLWENWGMFFTLHKHSIKNRKLKLNNLPSKKHVIFKFHWDEWLITVLHLFVKSMLHFKPLSHLSPVKPVHPSVTQALTKRYAVKTSQVSLQCSSLSRFFLQDAKCKNKPSYLGAITFY